MDLRELLTHLHDFVQLPEQNIDITSIEMDSREVKLRIIVHLYDGYTVDGHSFAQMAVEKGAVAILAEKTPADVEVPVVRVKSTKRLMAVLADAFYNQPTQKCI